MGGTVTVVIRESNGTEHRMQRWTNSLPLGICNVKMINEDREHLDKYLSKWYEMRDDWNVNHSTGNFSFNMTEAYFPCVGFAPQGYGFVLLDFKTKHLLSLQGYTHVDKILPPRIKSWDPRDYKDSLNNILELIKEKRIASLDSWDSGAKKIVVEHIPSHLGSQTTFQELENYLDLTFDKVGRAIHLNVDWSPFTVIDYEFNKDSLDVRDAYAKVKELGFKLSDEEELIWHEWIEEAKINSEE